MQVITGKFRGRRLISPESARPTLQRIKQSLFSMIADKINETTKVLDLFAGSGALGIECISRGANFCVFVDNNKEASQVIETNLKNVDKNLFQILNQDYLNALRNLRGQKFDIVFLDPPYESNLLIPCVDIIQRFELLSKDGILVAETSQKNMLQELSKRCIINKQKNYGLMQISILRTIQE